MAGTPFSRESLGSGYFLSITGKGKGSEKDLGF